MSYVARATLALADAGPGRTVNLVAGHEAATGGELIDLAAHQLGQQPVRATSSA